MNNLLSLHDRIEEDIQAHKIILFMKGSKMAPMCGFSARVVDILLEYGVEFETRNVLEDDNLRQSIKSYSNWPTLPQLYINGHFVGGCDIINEMHEAGELQELLQV